MLLLFFFLLFVDMFNFIRILSDYQDNAGHEEKRGQEELQDKSVLYNEVLQVIRALYKITREVREEERYVKVKDLGDVYNPLDDKDIDEEIEFADNPSSYLVDADIIFEAWIRYRPKTERHHGSNNNHSSENISNSANNMREFGNAVRSRKSRQNFNEKFPLNDIEKEIMEEEKKIVKKFLSKFVANPELSKLNLIDIARVIKALPTTFNSNNVTKTDFINMRNVQLALIGYQNESQDKLFQFYDSRIKQRMMALDKRQYENDEFIQDIKKYANSILSHMSRMKKLEDTSKKNIPLHLDSDEEAK